MQAAPRGDVGSRSLLGGAVASYLEVTRTSRPAGEWLRIALDVAESQHVSFQDRTRLLALVSMALADVVAPTFMSKFVYQH